ncbi:MAG: hypothetical protein AVDCRST_MAG19-1100, partial [uncultured Thermomicrobiales bacterium]
CRLSRSWSWGGSSPAGQGGAGRSLPRACPRRPCSNRCQASRWSSRSLKGSIAP